MRGNCPGPVLISFVSAYTTCGCRQSGPVFRKTVLTASCQRDRRGASTRLGGRFSGEGPQRPETEPAAEQEEGDRGEEGEGVELRVLRVAPVLDLRLLQAVDLLVDLLEVLHVLRAEELPPCLLRDRLKVRGVELLVRRRPAALERVEPVDEPARADRVHADPLLLREGGRLPREDLPDVVLPVREEDHDLALPPGGDQRLDRAGEADADRRAVLVPELRDLDAVEELDEGLLVERERASQVGVAREGDEGEPIVAAGARESRDDLLHDGEAAPSLPPVPVGPAPPAGPRERGVDPPGIEEDLPPPPGRGGGADGGAEGGETLKQQGEAPPGEAAPRQAGGEGARREEDSDPPPPGEEREGDEEDEEEEPGLPELEERASREGDHAAASAGALARSGRVSSTNRRALASASATSSRLGRCRAYLTRSQASRNERSRPRLSREKPRKEAASSRNSSVVRSGARRPKRPSM